MIGDNRENIVQFLSIPVVSLKEKFKNEKEENKIFIENTNKYRPYLKEDFKSCDEEIAKLADKEEKGELDKNLILYIKKQNDELKRLNES